MPRFPLAGASHTLDLTQPFFHGCGFNPDLPQPSVDVVRHVVSDGVRLEQLNLCTHVGTHMDAPAHVFESGSAIDQFGCAQFHGRAAVADLRHLSPGAPITVADLERRALPEAEILLLVTGWGARREHTERYVNQSPWLDRSAAQWVVDHGFAGVVIDHFSIASRGDPEKVMPAHLTLLGAGAWIVEDALLPDELFTRPEWYVIALPLRISDGSGAPTRVIAIAR